MRNILLADDEKEIVELIELYLNKDDFNVIKTYDGMDALRAVNTQNIDIAVIDIMMPGIDGFQLLKKIRESLNIPVIILSAKNEDYDKILGLGIGADDYVTKPFNPLELVARIEAQLRRFYKFNTPVNTKITIGAVTLNEDSCTVYKDGAEVLLTSTEYKIMELLMKSAGRVFTKRQIFEKVWEDNYVGDDNTVMVHLSNLRDKLEDNPKAPQYIKTVRGLGYKFEKKGLNFEKTE